MTRRAREVDRNGLEVLDRDECVALLRRVPVGRMGLSSGALPTILPVNFVVAGDRVVVRTVRGGKLDAATRDTVVAFEADEFDPGGRWGWSVVATGVARELAPADAAGLDLSGLRRWVAGADDRLIAVSLDVLTGRWLGPPAPGRRDRSLTARTGR